MRIGISSKNYYNKNGEPVSRWRSDASNLGYNWMDLVYRRTHPDPLKHIDDVDRIKY